MTRATRKGSAAQATDPFLTSALPLFLAAALAVATTGCLTMPPRSRDASSVAVTLDEVPVHKFGVDRCGPGSLSAVLTYLGDEPVTMEELDAELERADNNGVVSIDMLLAARSRGWDARLVEGSPELLRETLLARRPAILILRVLNAPGVGRDYFHYVVVDGYDPERELFRLQFGDGQRRWAPMDGLERAWKGTDHATILVDRPVGGAPAGGIEASGLRYAAALEEMGRPAEAVEVVRRVLEEEPGSALAWTNLGNGEAAAGRPEEAERAYRRALEIDPAQRDALNNLAWLLLEGGSDLDEAEALARRAVEAGGADRHLVLDTLGRVLRARGRCGEAAEVFEEGLSAAPAGDGARSWLELGLGLSLRDCGRRDAARAHLERAMSSGNDAVRAEAAAAMAVRPGSP